jgi:hypothetical protein
LRIRVVFFFFFSPRVTDSGLFSRNCSTYQGITYRVTFAVRAIAKDDGFSFRLFANGADTNLFWRIDATGQLVVATNATDVFRVVSAGSGYNIFGNNSTLPLRCTYANDIETSANATGSEFGFAVAPAPSATPSISVSPSISRSPSITPSISRSPSITPSVSPSISVSPTALPISVNAITDGTVYNINCVELAVGSPRYLLASSLNVNNNFVFTWRLGDARTLETM